MLQYYKIKYGMLGCFFFSLTLKILKDQGDNLVGEDRARNEFEEGGATGRNFGFSLSDLRSHWRLQSRSGT